MKINQSDNTTFGKYFRPRNLTKSERELFNTLQDNLTIAGRNVDIKVGKYKRTSYLQVGPTAKLRKICRKFNLPLPEKLRDYRPEHLPKFENLKDILVSVAELKAYFLQDAKTIAARQKLQSFTNRNFQEYLEVARLIN